MFINKKLVRKLDLETEEIGHAIRVTNADGSHNKGGPITEYVTAELDIGPHHSVSQMFCAKLGETDVIIGFTFLWMFNPKIDWRKGEWLIPESPEYNSSPKASKTVMRPLTVSQDETDDLEEEPDMEFHLDNIGMEDPIDPMLDWYSVGDDEQ